MTAWHTREDWGCQLAAEQLAAVPKAEDSPEAASCPAAVLSACATSCELHASPKLAFAALALNPHSKHTLAAEPWQQADTKLMCSLDVAMMECFHASLLDVYVAQMKHTKQQQHILVTHEDVTPKATGCVSIFV